MAGDPENGIGEAEVEGVEDGLEVAVGGGRLDHDGLVFPAVLDGLEAREQLECASGSELETGMAQPELQGLGQQVGQEADDGAPGRGAG